MADLSAVCSCGRVFADLPEDRIHCTIHHVDEPVPGVFDDPAWDVWTVCDGCGHVYRTEYDVIVAAGIDVPSGLTYAEDAAAAVPACPLCGADWTTER